MDGELHPHRLSVPQASVRDMTITLGQITVDTTDPIPLAHWWAERFGAAVGETNDGWFVSVAGGTLPVGLAFQKIEEPAPGKNRIHLDLVAKDSAAQVAHFVEAGATVVAEHTIPTPDGEFGWTVLADPQDNQFCISQQH